MSENTRALALSVADRQRAVVAAYRKQMEAPLSPASARMLVLKGATKTGKPSFAALPAPGADQLLDQSLTPEEREEVWTAVADGCPPLVKAVGVKIIDPDSVKGTSGKRFLVIGALLRAAAHPGDAEAAALTEAEELVLAEANRTGKAPK